MAELSNIKILRKDELKSTFCESPHVVILGAGASCAAIPNGDLSGRHIPVMNNFLQEAGLVSVIAGIDLDTKSRNIEDIYSEISRKAKNNPKYLKVMQKLQSEIQKYIADFKIPRECTVYDYLLYSLTEKDYILSFNWDSLLLQAYGRTHSQFLGHLPKILFLHGNVGVGYCAKCNVFGNVGRNCECCGGVYQPMPLLFPVQNKDYTRDVSIRNSWEEALNAVARASLITVFGYSMPASDADAVELFKSAWSNSFFSEFGDIEIINMRSEENNLIEKIIDFAPESRPLFCESFFDSMLAKYPRRTTETHYKESMGCEFVPSANCICNGMDRIDLELMTNSLILKEKKGVCYE